MSLLFIVGVSLIVTSVFMALIDRISRLEERVEVLEGKKITTLRG